MMGYIFLADKKVGQVFSAEKKEQEIVGYIFWADKRKLELVGHIF